ncbi:MAG: hypothetical protein ACR2M8_00780 [Pyrinomonadaceae bacterium]|nr:hypothetical protein [Acidobacteriota bacterium]
MPKRIGLIQTRGIGDIIIALPIADFYEEQGFEVCWPIDRRFVEMFRRIKPSIRFFPVDEGPGFFYLDPLSILRENDCEKIISLYSYLSNLNIYDGRLSALLKFDEYKYAISGVPFARKWTLKYDRDIEREQALYDSLGITGDYICYHSTGSGLVLQRELPPHITRGLQLIRVESLTDSPFDWLLTLERAGKLVLVDSCFSNLVEQMNLSNEKYLAARSPVSFTPVYKNGWRFIFLDPAEPD